ncbi:RimJ/RimL family protein N-acetyltransferase [Nocardioides albertanoniae]|uniref:RimJ/RimL family protein N-acetyltransferase n=1 Tax=Nocardioides albertanoniae TaxID=1175486 RepID=A0A543AAL2_9ACTN|nr:GNAT family N-acetyltransferase [Nocardioides albertanoniae]TQL69550.1 RimJ/RimL family protein N-acetyltransferase [Nocardioides albertanoniae]
MKPLGPVPWPPAPIVTERLTLRETRPEDRPALAKLLSDERVQHYLGGPQHTREELEQLIPEDPNTRPGIFAVEHEHRFIGRVTVQRRDRSWPHHVREEGDEVEIGYELFPESWGQGLAAEAASAAIAWIEKTLPGEPIVLTTRVANVRSLRLAQRLGFVEVERFTAYGAEQWFGHLDPRGQASVSSMLAVHSPSPSGSSTPQVG